MSRLPDLPQIADELRARARDLAFELAPGGRLHGAEYDAPNPVTLDGKLGKFIINVDKGVFADFRDASVRGDMLNLIGYCLFNDRLAISEARKWALAWLGYTSADGKVVALDPAAAKARRDEAEALAKMRAEKEEREAKLRRKAAARVWGMAERLTGDDPASLYLKGRGLDLTDWPYLRMPLRVVQMRHPGTGEDTVHWTLIMAVRSLDTFLTIHRTYLMPDGKGGWVKLNVPDQRPEKAGEAVKAKLAFGPYKGGAVWFHPWAGWPPETADRKWPSVNMARNECGLTEGCENALSCAMSAPHLWHGATISLSNLANVELPQGMKPIVFRDNDEPGSPADIGFRKAMTQLYTRGHPPRVTAAPQGVKDANDLLNGESDDDA